MLFCWVFFPLSLLENDFEDNEFMNSTWIRIQVTGPLNDFLAKCGFSSSMSLGLQQHLCFILKYRWRSSHGVFPYLFQPISTWSRRKWNHQIKHGWTTVLKCTSWRWNFQLCPTTHISYTNQFDVFSLFWSVYVGYSWIFHDSCSSKKFLLSNKILVAELLRAISILMAGCSHSSRHMEGCRWLAIPTKTPYQAGLTPVRCDSWAFPSGWMYLVS